MRVPFLILLVFLTSCATMEDAMTPDVPLDMATLHNDIYKAERIIVTALENRVEAISNVQESDGDKYFNDIQNVKDRLNVFARWLRKSGLDDRVYEAVVVRLRVWEDMQAFFCVQDDAYLRHDLPLDEGTKAEVWKYLDFLLEASKKVEKWIDEKGVIEDG